MPRGTTKFCSKWLNEKDENGHTIGQWGREHTEYTMRCIFCKKEFDIRNSGIMQVLQHAKGKKHVTLVRVHLNQKQSRFLVSDASTSSNENKTSIVSLATDHSQTWSLTEADLVTRAEVYWCLQAATYGYSYNSCGKLGLLFSKMFPSSDIAKRFSISDTKISYCIAHGIGPHLQKELVSSIGNSFYVISMDEATSDQAKKQLDFHIRFWDESKNIIVSNFLCSFELGHATADIQKEKFISVLSENNLQPNKLLMIGSDGPAVNIKLLKDMNTYVKTKNSQGLISIGTCNLHIIHNSFGKAMDTIPTWEIEDFLVKLHKWFHKYPARKEDLANIQKEIDKIELVVLRYVNNRWLSVVPVLKRIIAIFPSLHEYFTVYLPKNTRKIEDNPHYLFLRDKLVSPLIKARICFLVSVGEDYSKTLTLLQRSSPLIHVLYDELVTLLKSLMFRVYKPELVRDLNGNKIKSFVSSGSNNELAHNKIDIGTITIEELKQVQEKLRMEFRSDCRSFLHKAISYLTKMLPIDDKLLHALQCLHPLSRTEEIGSRLVTTVCKEMPNVISLQDLDAIKTEWNLYMCEKLNDEELDSPLPIDKYWANVLLLKNSFNGKKYPFLDMVVKAALTLSHGQSDIERGFSLNKTNVTIRRASLSIESINGLRHIQDKTKHYSDVSEVPITPGLLKCMREAHAKMLVHKEEEKLKKKIEDNDAAYRKRKMEEEDKVSRLQKMERSAKEQVNRGNKLMAEANDRLTNALKGASINKTEVCAAQGLLATAQKCIQSGSKDSEYAQSELIKLNKRHKTLK